MIEYIKSQLQRQYPTSKPSSIEETSNEVPNDVIVEYARLFQELDDISIEGDDTGRERKLGIDIPLEDDLEIETIEFNLNDGRVTDVPGDATVAESSYESMKTYEEFYQEIKNSTKRFARETEDVFDKRVRRIADKMYTEYCEDASRIGEFGFEKISMKDSRVPSKINVDFGPITKGSDKSFMSKVKTFFETDDKHFITKKQLDSVCLLQEGALSKIGEPLMTYMESHYNIPDGNDVWDICTPKNVIVPKGNGDSFCVVLEYTNELTGKSEFFGWTRSVKSNKDVTENDVKSNMKSFMEAVQYENRDQILHEIEEEKTRKQSTRKPMTRSRFFQEAIDFGGGDDAGSDLPPAPDDGGNEASSDSGSDTTNVSVDANSGDNTESSDASVDTGNTSDAPESNDDSGDKEVAAVNNVSAEIAQKVSDKTQEDTGAVDDEEITFDDDFGSTDDSSENVDNEGMDEMGSEDEGSSIDDQLNDLDNSGDESMDSDEDMGEMDEDGTDVNNLTIDEIIEQGSEKLKGMTINEIKNFIDSGDKAAIQEAFILTPKNINKEIDINLRKCLGILNDNEMDVDKIVKSFKLSGHKLNRVLSKAVKMKKIYSSDEIESIKKLNKALGELMISLKKSKESSYISSIKRNIEAFTEESKVVSAFIEDKLNGNTVQEGFVQEGLFLSPNNAKRRLSRALIPVHSDMINILKAYKDNRLTKGKLIKMYKPKKGSSSSSVGTGINIPGSVGLGVGTASSNSWEYDINTTATRNISDLTSLISKILRKNKVQDVFTSEELSNISNLSDELDVFVDIIESIIFDPTSDNETLIKRIGESTKNITDLLATLFSSCNSGQSIVTDNSSFKGINDEKLDLSKDIDESDDDTSDEEVLTDESSDDKNDDEEVPDTDEMETSDEESDDSEKEQEEGNDEE